MAKYKMTTNVDQYFIDGCGRCELFATPKCKVNTWKEELQHLRIILLDSELTEECKWGMPCYSYQKKNIILLAAFKEFCSLNFFKGALLKDQKGILVKPGENSQSARLAKFTNVKDIIKLQSVLKAYIKEAIELEKSGAKVKFKESAEHDIPVELQNKLNKNSALKKAFYALTPGRQRGYLLFFSAAKQSATRESRIEKCMKQILKGKGLND